MTTVVQIAPEIGPGSGVAAVAHHLEAELALLHVPTTRVTLVDAYGSWLPEPGPGVTGKAALAARVAWFSTVGTVVARRILRGLPDAVAICHNDALAGAVYVNHGIVLAAMRARGHATLRMARNPLHLFTLARDTVRFRHPDAPRRRQPHRRGGRASAGDLPEGRARHRGDRQRRRHAATPPAQ